MRPEPDPDALARFLAGRSDADEETRVRAWLDAHPTARPALEGAPTDASLRDPEAALARLRTRHQATVRPLHPDRPALRRVALYRLTAVAAVLAVLAIGALLLLRVRHEASPALAFREVATAAGELRRAALPDGSTVELNAETHLRPTGRFGDAHREVALEGEAFFDVARDTLRPFVIHSGRAVVQVLGTSFNVEAYPDDDRVTVVVVSGRVTLRPAAGGAAVVLTPGQMGRVGPDGRPTVARVDPAVFLAWRGGGLAFRGTPLDEVAREIERRYAVEVEVDAGVPAALRLDATFLPSDAPADVAATVAAALGLRYRIDARRITFLPR